MPALVVETAESCVGDVVASCPVLVDSRESSLAEFSWQGEIETSWLDVSGYWVVGGRAIVQQEGGLVSCLQPGEALRTATLLVEYGGVSLSESVGHRQLYCEYMGSATVLDQLGRPLFHVPGSFSRHRLSDQGLWLAEKVKGQPTIVREVDESGRVRWKLTLEPGWSVIDMPTPISAGVCVMACAVSPDSGQLLWIDRVDGSVLRRKQVPFLTSATVSSDVAVLGTSGSVLLIALRDGTAVGNRDFAGAGKCFAAFALDGIVVITQAGSELLLLSLDLKTELGRVRLPPDFRPYTNSTFSLSPTGVGLGVTTPYRPGERVRHGSLFVSDFNSSQCAMAPSSPPDRVRRRSGRKVVHTLLVPDGDRYQLARNVRLGLRDAFYALGQVGTSPCPATHDADHEGDIVIEYAGKDDATFAHLERMAAEETDWAKAMALHAGAGERHRFCVTARRV